ncbi:MAG TPA: ricin-type beta-trefoil lectin domain protein [Mycobacteriales bacterium]|nr:ricin-type beta-trefoil lectin domain protein [Mycobacteriales bacterium]
MRARILAPLGALTLLAAAGLLAVAPPAGAAGETVNIWLTTTDDAAGRHVVRGLQQQTPVTFSAGTGGVGQNITVDENTRFQQFVGGGASFTDTAAWLMNSSGALSAATRNSVMMSLFSPTTGIGLGFLRNPMGASDLARFSYSYDDLPAGQTDPSMTRFSIAHDLADVVPLTRQARTLNPDLKVMGSPWSAPGWMKDSGTMNGGFLQAQYYGAYAQYFVKYIQAYQAQGIPIDFVSVQNEPTCCAGYPSMSWNGSGLDFFMKTNLFPAMHAAGLSTKVLALDWNWDAYPDFGSVPVGDATVRNDPNFGGMAWHGYGGNVAMQSTIHDQFPTLSAYDTEHSGGTWITNQQQEDMHNIVDYTRNWGRTVTKWSLAVDQNMGPHNGGCGTCTGLVTVHNGDARSGQVDFTVEYYDMGHLTKFVRPGATRIASTASAAVPNVAWRNPDGSKALVAYNDTATAQTVRVNWGGSSFSYSLPTKTTATFTWAGTQAGGGAPSGPITGLAGKCADVAAGATANGTAVQLFTCNGSAAQRWTLPAGGTVQALGKCLDVTSAGTADGTPVQLWDCNGTAAQQWTYTAGHDLMNPAANKCLDVTGNVSTDGTRLQIWTCTGGANQKWTVPAS